MCYCEKYMSNDFFFFPFRQISDKDSRLSHAEYDQAHQSNEYEKYTDKF